MPAEPSRSPSGKGVNEYLKVARQTGAFRPCELSILEEVLVDAFQDPSKGYLFVKMQEQGNIEGFAVFGRSPMTAWGWDLYWIVVEKRLQGKGRGKALLGLLEKVALAETGRVILRAETSGRPEYEGQRLFYLGAGFKETGRISDFYEAGDDLVTFCKFIS